MQNFSLGKLTETYNEERLGLGLGVDYRQKTVYIQLFSPNNRLCYCPGK